MFAWFSKFPQIDLEPPAPKMVAICETCYPGHKGGDLLGKWDITGTSTEEQRALPSGWEREKMELKKKAASDGSGLTNSPGFCGQNRVA